MDNDAIHNDFVTEAIRQQNPDFETNSVYLYKSWESRTANLYRFRFSMPGYTDIVVKVLKDPTTAWLLYDSMRETYEVLKAADAEKVPDFQPFGYSEPLGAVVMPFVSGESLANILQTRRPDLDALDNINNHLIRCGQILGTYHAKFWDEQRSHLEDASRDFENRMKLVLGKKAGLAGKLIENVQISKRYGDYHAGHVIISDNYVVPIDPPLTTEFVFIYRDISRFTYELFMLHFHPITRARGLHHVWRYQELSEKFLQGYYESFQPPKGIPNKLNRALLWAFEAFNLRRTFRRLILRKNMKLLIYYGIPLLLRFYSHKRKLMKYIDKS